MVGGDNLKPVTSQNQTAMRTESVSKSIENEEYDNIIIRGLKEENCQLAEENKMLLEALVVVENSIKTTGLFSGSLMHNKILQTIEKATKVL